ncbi:MAG TPA: PepSY-associated TM helix domain-containing protein [Stellaceae bacterium]|jgi:uncharacterized iron-regulated membrane protein|nr:PepSY-associated TM helix domain-containing protein [Stellaceae bacterium]
MIRGVIRQIHLWAGIALCVPLVLLGLTGSLLVFEDELTGIFTPPPPVAVGDAKPVSAVIAAARAAAPAGFVTQSYIAAPPKGLATVRLIPPRRGGEKASAAAARPGGEMLRISVDPVSLATYTNPAEGFLRQVFYLHTNLLLKTREGRQLVGWLGVVMLIMGISGLVNWLPRPNQWRNGQWRRAFAVRRGARGFLLNRELHGAAGIWGLVVFVVVSFGGVELAFPETVRAIVNVAMPARDLRAGAAAIKVEPQRGAEPMAIDDAIALARSQVPDADLRFVFLPMRPDQPIRVALSRAGQERREPTATVFIDPWTRRIVDTYDPRQYSAGESLLAWQHAIHAGQGLGPIWKVLVFFVGFLPLLFSATGLAMWWLKRCRRAVVDAAADAIVDPVYTARRAGE